MRCHSSIIRVLLLVVQVGEGGEGLRSESVQLVSKELDLLSLLLDNVHELALVGHLLDLFGRVLRAAIIASLRLQAHDLLALIHVLLKLSRLGLELLVFT